MAIIQSGATADLLTVDPTSKAIRNTPYDTAGIAIPKQAGGVKGSTDSFLPIGGINDDNYRLQRMDRLGSSAVALNNVLLSEPFEAAVVSTPNRFIAATTTFAPAQTSAGGYSFNATGLTTSASASLLTSARYFPKFQRTPLHAKVRARVGHVTNAVAEFGFGAPASQTVSPTVGAYFQITAGGVVQGVLTFNSVDVTTTITMPGSWQNNYFTWDIIMDDDEVIFMVQDTSTGLIVAEKRIQLAITQIRLWNASRLPWFSRLHFPSAPASAAHLIITSVDIVSLDTLMNKPWQHVAAHMGLGQEVSPTAMTQTANYTNSTVPTSATLSNTAAGYTTLGGQFQFAAVAGAETDYALFGFTVPVPYSFLCTGIDIDTFNMGAAVATTPTTMQWFASPDQTAISLATATNRRVTLGVNSLPIGTVIGGNADRSISRDFTHSPLVSNPGRILVVGLKMPVGTATASQIVRGTVAIKGYFE